MFRLYPSLICHNKFTSELLLMIGICINLKLGNQKMPTALYQQFGSLSTRLILQEIACSVNGSHMYCGFGKVFSLHEYTV